MLTSPGEAFHSYFQTLDPSWHNYKGRADLGDLQTCTVSSSLLAEIQEMFNGALHNENKNVREHVEHDPFYFDFIDSAELNALAFCHEGYAFIGITTGLINLVDDVCRRLGHPKAGAMRMALRLTSAETVNLRVVLFFVQLNFVLSHEFTHHVHGHLSRISSAVTVVDEVMNTDAGGLEDQTVEADADGYAAYYVLANLLDGPLRQVVVSLLAIDETPTDVQDEIIMSCFVVAVGGFLLVLLPPQPVDSTNIYTFSHPPKAARMNLLMQQAMSWCRQNRPSLEAWMTLTRFQMLMRTVATFVPEANWETSGGKDWLTENKFFHSGAGAEYFAKLHRELEAHVMGLGNSALE